MTTSIDPQNQGSPSRKEIHSFLKIDQPLNLKTTLESGQVFRWRSDGEWHIGMINKHAYALRQEQDGLKFRTSNPSISEAITNLRNFLRLDDDLNAIYEKISEEKPLAEAIFHHKGLRLLRQDPWECLASFVCSSVSNIRRISSNLQSIAKYCGELIKFDGHCLYSFPNPKILAEAGEKPLLDLGLGFRARYLAQISNLIAAEKISLMSLRDTSYQQAKDSLIWFPGIGNKVADCVLVFSLNKLEGFPIDRWVRRALEDWYDLNPKTKYEDVAYWARERWGENAGYVQQYLFHHRRLMN